MKLNGVKSIKKIEKKVNTYEWGEDPEMSGPRNYFRESMIVNSVKRFKNKGIILDAGCGSGSLSIRLIRIGYRLVSIDLADRSLFFLKNKAENLNLSKRIKVQKASILNLPFLSSSFDGVVCGEVLEHITNDEKAISELYRVLKKGGICVVTVPAHPEMWDLSDDISLHQRRYTKEELKEKFIKSGFNIIKCSYWGYPLNNLWHRYIFIKFLKNKMKQHSNITHDSSIKAKIIKNSLFQSIFSKLFYFDYLLSFTNRGNALILIAKK